MCFPDSERALRELDPVTHFKITVFLIAEKGHESTRVDNWRDLNAKINFDRLNPNRKANSWTNNAN